MPENNQFRHQNYPTTPNLTPAFHTLDANDRTDFSRLHTELAVRDVILVHGTFMGDDSFAVAETLTAIGKSVPPLKGPLQSLSNQLRQHTKPLTEKVTQDVGNYTVEYKDAFQKLVGSDPTVRLMTPTWSGQNHHLARADLAVRLLCDLDELGLSSSERVLLWGHSHAGNGFALLSNLLANDHDYVEQFFSAVDSAPNEFWPRARDILLSSPSPHPLAESILIAAFGTPVRYGWDQAGYRKLVHILHHRNFSADDPLVTHRMFPPHTLSETIHAEFGDWVQSFGIAGTDVVPPTSRSENGKLTELVEAGLQEPQHGLDTKFIVPKRIRDACARWKTGTRCHTDGQNILVRYNECGRKTHLGNPIEEALLGHGVATTTDWLPAHLSLVIGSLS